MKPLSILVVEDDADVMKIVRLILERASHHVTAVASVAGALGLVRRQCFDVVLSDVLVGEDDGIDVLREARLLQPTARLVAMSGGGRLLHPSFCLTIAAAFGAVRLKKPFDAAELLLAVEGAAAVALSAT